MDNKASANNSSASSSGKNSGFILRGLLYAPSDRDPNADVTVSGVSVYIKGVSKDTTACTAVSGTSGEFSAPILLPYGKYQFIFTDATSKYQHGPFTTYIKGDTDLPPIYMGIVGQPAKKKRKNNISGRWRLYGHVTNQKKESLSEISVSIRSLSLDPPKGFLEKTGKRLGNLMRKLNNSKEEKYIAIDTKTNAVGLFFAGRELPNGRYKVACYDPGGKYKFISQTIIIKNGLYKAMSFVGYTLDNETPIPKTPEEQAAELEEKRKIEAELEKYKEASGKEVRLTEKVRRSAPTVTTEQATDRLAAIKTAEKEPEIKPEKQQTSANLGLEERPSGLVVPQGKPAKEARTEPREDQEKKAETPKKGGPEQDGTGQPAKQTEVKSDDATREAERIIREHVQQKTSGPTETERQTVHAPVTVLERPQPTQIQMPPPITYPGIETISRPPSMTESGRILSPQQQMARKVQNKPRIPNRRKNPVDLANGGAKDVQQALQLIKTVVSPQRKIYLFIGLFFLFLVIIMFFFDGGGGFNPLTDSSSSSTTGADTGTDTSTPAFPPIPGLTITLSGPESINNGDQLSYNVKITIDASKLTVPVEDIVVSDPIPDNAKYSNNTGVGTYNPDTNAVEWSLADETNRDSFTVTLSPTASDVLITNTIVAHANAPVSTGSSGNACTAPYEGTGPCTVANLRKYFPDDTKALIASLICDSESGSDPYKVNNTCTGKGNDYSVGLFQINAVAHCAGAYGSQSCTNLLSASIRNVCETSWTNPDTNILKAKELSSNGSQWGIWSTWAIKGKNPPVVETLSKCGINYQ